jgi:hypothetical protein
MVWLVLLLVVGLPIAHVVYVHTSLRRLRSEVDTLRNDLAELSVAPASVATQAVGAVPEPGPARVAELEPIPWPYFVPAATTWTGVAAAAPAADTPDEAPPPEEPWEPEQPHERPAAEVAEAPGTEPARWGRPRFPAAPAPARADAHADDFEIQLGTTWTLRIGLAAIAIAAALFARTVVPDLPAVAKVALAYAGAWLLFGVGKYVERRLERFARPVMASGLALAFFVSFAAYFVPAMRAVPLAASLLWMAAGVAAVLVFATRWQSQPTAALAIFLGHVTAFVAAGDGSGASLVAIAFLALTAGVLLLRNDWLPLSLFAVVAANGTHLLWALAAQGTMPRPTFIALNLLFLSSYYLIFLTADLLWWRRRGGATMAFDAPVPGRAFGPTNLVVFVALAWWMLAQGSATPATSSIFFFVLAAVQVALAVAVRRMGSPDDAIYFVAGTALLTIGLFGAFDALALDLLLAALALVLLLIAQRARRRTFHALAQGALVVSFLQYWLGAAPPDTGLAGLLGGLAIAIAYLVMSQLEVTWYGREATPWGKPMAAFRALKDAWDAIFERVAPALPAAHAVAGALIVLRTIDTHVPPDAAAAAASAALVALTALVIRRRNLPLGLAWLVAQFGVLLFVKGASAPSVGLGVAAIGVGASLLLAMRAARADAPFGRMGAWIAQVGLWLAAAAIPLGLVVTTGAASTATYLAWIGVIGLVFAFAARAGFASVAAPGATAKDLLRDTAAPLTAGAGALLVLYVTHELLGAVAPAPVWASGWAGLLAVVAWRRRDRALDIGAFLLVATTAPHFLLVVGLGPTVAGMLWASAVVIGVPLLLALAWDHRLRAATTELGPLTVPYGLYTLGALIWVYVVIERTGFPWSDAWAMLLPIALLLAALRGTVPRAPWVALTLTLTLALRQLGDLISHSGVTGMAGDNAAAWATAITGVAVVTVERLSGRHTAAVGTGARWLSLTLVGTTGALALAAVFVADGFGAAWTTIGWSLVAATILALGFVWRSAAYRRVGLVVFALTLGRVFLVDVRSLPTGTQTLAFLALGVSLVAVAWLYARFAGEVRRWL